MIKKLALCAAGGALLIPLLAAAGPALCQDGSLATSHTGGACPGDVVEVTSTTQVGCTATYFQTSDIGQLSNPCAQYVPASGGAGNSFETLAAQIQALLAQVQQLQALLAQLTGATSTPPTPPYPILCPSGSHADNTNGGCVPDVSRGFCPVFSRALFKGLSGNDVTQLQQFLVDQGLLSSDNVTGLFGSATQAAVQQLQSQQGVVSSGSPDTTGWGVVGVQTRAWFGRRCGGGGSGNFSASPTSGPVPLAVTFSMPSFTITSKDSVPAAARQNILYGVDFGDNTPVQGFQISCPMNGGIGSVCNIAVTHTYSSSGSYTAKLLYRSYDSLVASCGGSPDSACPAAISLFQPVNTVVITVGGTNQSGYSVSPTSGSAPLTVTVSSSYGIPSWCSAAEQPILRPADLGYTSINFGDGTALQQYPECSPGLSHTYTANGTYTVTATPYGGFPSPQPYTPPVIPVGTVTVGGTSSSNLNATPTSGAAPLSVHFTGTMPVGALLDFGDGTPQIGSGCGDCGTNPPPTPFDTTHVYYSNGIYTAKIIASNGTMCANCDQRASVIGSVTITVGSASTLTASLTAQGLVNSGTLSITAAPGDHLPFTWSSTGGVSATSYYVADKADGCGHGAGISYDWLAHTLNGTGGDVIPACEAGVTYVIRYVVTASDGRTAQSALILHVTGSTPTSNTVSISGVDGPSALGVGQIGTWTVHASVPSGTAHYSVIWGDEYAYALIQAFAGSSQTNVQTSSTFTHAYQSAGNYAPIFTVTADQGKGTAQASASVQVGIQGVKSCPTYMMQACPAGQHWQSSSPTYDVNNCPIPQGQCMPGQAQ